MTSKALSLSVIGVFLTVLSVAVGPAADLAPAWKAIGPPGGFLTALAVQPTNENTVLCGTYSGGIYRTANGGGGWQPVGRSVFDCHPEPARTKTRRLYETQQANHYTIRKNGQRKIIHQLPWFESGTFAGFVEISIPIPDDLPHFDRD